jgi:hypothetical protein
VELFMSDGTFEGARSGDRSEVVTEDRYGSGAVEKAFYPTQGGDLESSPETGANSVLFAGDATGFADPDAGRGATFSTPALKDDLVIAGLPKLDLAASVTAPRVHLISTPYDENDKGERRRIGQFTINPELRSGIARRDAVTPGVRYDMKPPGFAMAHQLRAGHKLVLKVATSDPDKVPTFANDPKVTVFTGPGTTSFTLPVLENAALYKDEVPLEDAQSVPDGPAQAPFAGSATPVAPGGGARVAGVDSAFYEFDAGEGHANAKLVVEATYGTGDVDLYLQREQADGTWSDDLATGGSSSLSGEQLTSGRVDPGHYRVEVVNYAAPPGTKVDLAGTFFDTGGRPGA